MTIGNLQGHPQVHPSLPKLQPIQRREYNRGSLRELRRVSPGQLVGWAAKRAASGLQLAASAMSSRHEENGHTRLICSPTNRLIPLAFHPTPPLSPALGSIIEAQIIISFTST